MGEHPVLTFFLTIIIGDVVVRVAYYISRR